MDRLLYDRWLPPKAREAIENLRRLYEADVARAARVIKDLDGIRSLRDSIHECHDVKRELTLYYATRAKK